MHVEEGLRLGLVCINSRSGERGEEVAEVVGVKCQRDLRLPRQLQISQDRVIGPRPLRPVRHMQRGQGLRKARIRSFFDAYLSSFYFETIPEIKNSLMSANFVEISANIPAGVSMQLW